MVITPLWYNSVNYPLDFQDMYWIALQNCLDEQINAGVTVANDGFLKRENPIYHFW